jgi:UDP-2,4-diacetamido-2,4,6-trideoxy-beta-L-altropyranose hydrolase
MSRVATIVVVDTLRMRILFRTDASVEIGTGHVVRCAALAQRLRESGHEVEFVCRDWAGNLNGWLTTQGFRVTLPTGKDAVATKAIIGARHFDWIVVDHYELGAEWEASLSSSITRIMAFDDIGRTHDCDMLLDQNYANPVHALYQERVPHRCQLLLGPQFATIRPEFAKLRSVSCLRERTSLDRILIFMGGTDPENETVKALNGVALSGESNCDVDVVIGEGNPHRADVEAVITRLPSAQLHVQTSRMAELMAAADLAIGAGGSTTWERCVLGLPAMVTILAENQASSAEAVAASGAHQLLGWHQRIAAEDYAKALFALNPGTLRRMSEAAAAICDGNGADRIVALLMKHRDVSNNVPGKSDV